VAAITSQLHTNIQISCSGIASSNSATFADHLCSPHQPHQHLPVPGTTTPRHNHQYPNITHNYDIMTSFSPAVCATTSHHVGRIWPCTSPEEPHVDHNDGIYSVPSRLWHYRCPRSACQASQVVPEMNEFTYMKVPEFVYVAGPKSEPCEGREYVET
jgi:hypothetical protein